MTKHAPFALLFVFLWGCTPTIESFDTDSGPTTNQRQEDANNSSIPSSGLQCESMSLCSTFVPSSEAIELPTNSEGTISDGTYQVIKGGSLFYGLVIMDGRFSYLWNDLTVSHGEITLAGDSVTLTTTTTCNRNDPSPPSELELDTIYTFATIGDDLYLRGQCGPPNGCPGATHFKKVASLCSDLSSYDCPDGRCNCEVFTSPSVPREISRANGCVR